MCIACYILDDTGFQFKVLKKIDDDNWYAFADKSLKFQPQYLYKYRTINENSIKDLENDTLWFSHPYDFDDTLDSSVNIDIEKELLEFEKDKNIFDSQLVNMFYLSKNTLISDIPLEKLFSYIDEQIQKLESISRKLYMTSEFGYNFPSLFIPIGVSTVYPSSTNAS